MNKVYAHQNGVWLEVGSVRKQYYIDDIIRLKGSHYPLKVIDIASDNNAIYTMFKCPVEQLKATDIDWDTDEAGDIDDLPDEIKIPIGMIDTEEISDYISNVTGFCHNGFVVEGLTYEHVLNTDWYEDADLVSLLNMNGEFINLPERCLLNATVRYAEKVDGEIELTLDI